MILIDVWSQIDFECLLFIVRDLNSSYQSLHNSCHLPMHQHSRPFISPTIPQDDYLCDAEVGGYMGQVDGNIIDDDIGADWFDEEILGHETPNWKFDWYPIYFICNLFRECRQLVCE